MIAWNRWKLYASQGTKRYKKTIDSKLYSIKFDNRDVYMHVSNSVNNRGSTNNLYRRYPVIRLVCLQMYTLFLHVIVIAETFPTEVNSLLVHSMVHEL